MSQVRSASSMNRIRHPPPFHAGASSGRALQHITYSRPIAGARPEGSREKLAAVDAIAEIGDARQLVVRFAVTDHRVESTACGPPLFATYHRNVRALQVVRKTGKTTLAPMNTLHGPRRRAARARIQQDLPRGEIRAVGVGPRQEERELTAEACHRIDIAQAGLETLGDFLQRAIAGVIAGASR